MNLNFIDIIEIIIKLAVGISILNVWLFNRNKSTPWRTKNADNMKEEFAAYGLSYTAMIMVGTLKCLFAVLLMVSIFYQVVEWVGAAGIAILMAGAISMHFKMGDPIKKSLPAAIFLVLSLLVIPL